MTDEYMAFPGYETHYEDDKDLPVSTPYDGMTLRDYFAAKAMQGILSASVIRKAGEPIGSQVVAELSYNMADAMLKAREKTEQE